MYPAHGASRPCECLMLQLTKSTRYFTAHSAACNDLTACALMKSETPDSRVSLE